MKEELIRLAQSQCADLLTVAPASRFPKEDPIFDLLPNVKSVIALGFRVLRGCYRGTEEGTTYYQYTTMGVENMEETVMPLASLAICRFLEEHGYLALPQRRHQQIMGEKDSTNPEVAYDAVYRGVTQEIQMDFPEAAVRCGLGERGFSGALLTDDFGPFIRYCFVLTDAEIEPDPVIMPHLCDNCGKCRTACPGQAVKKEGGIDPWQCAVYYNGANGLKNPFMPPDAFADDPERLKIIAGEAKVTPERAREILDQIYFYPPAQHAYQCSICGRACDTACYAHLEAQGKLKRKFHRPFRDREEWRFSLEDYKEK